MIRIFLLVTVVFLSHSFSFGKGGSLVIAGGAISSFNSEIFIEFIELAGGVESARIGIIAAASEKPVTYGNSTRESMIRHGAKPSNVFLLPIAVKNDTSTEENESLWIDNVFNDEVVKLIESCTGIWFSGGDQMRITKALLREGKRTLALEAIWRVYQEGGVIGGTSAGAAIMSEIMIAAGSSLEGLIYGFTNDYSDMSQQEEGPVHISQGLGFFGLGIIDQHFDRKARIGRLVMTTYLNRSGGLRGFGIDENTALVVYQNGKQAKSIGTGGVTVIDASMAEGGVVEDGRHWYKGIKVSFFEAGDVIDFETWEIKPNPVKKATMGNEYFNVTNSITGSTLSPNSLFKQQLSYLLVDNSELSEVQSHSFLSSGKGFVITLRKRSRTKGYWAYIGDEVDRYTVIDAELEIIPADFTVKQIVP